jgi:8-oxo-dGTP pyrophosphatase MutT (NUDIX family)
MPSHPTTLDRGIQLGFIVAHRMLRAYWAVRRPKTSKGTLVAVWHRSELLIVKNSYRRQHTLPGGYRRSGETPAQAGARELAEECSIFIDPERIREVYRGEHPFEFRKDDLTILETEIETRPATIGIDHREVIWAGFKSPDEILTMDIVPHLREYIVERKRRMAT